MRLGFSHRRLYFVLQLFTSETLERLLGPGMRAEDPNDDCLGRALDWLYAHDPTTLFASIALRAAQAGADDMPLFVADSGLYSAENMKSCPFLARTCMVTKNSLG
jgi:Domain of unknown function (DUF4277)